jgi:voltage-gated potassium channel
MIAHHKKRPIQGHGFRNLLFFLLLYIVGSPFLEPYPSLAVLAHISLTMTLFAAVYAVHKQQHQRSIAIGLLAPLLVLYWLGIYNIVPFSRPGANFLFAVYYGLLIYSFVIQIIRTHRVTPHVLYATFCIYLLLGLFWGTLYSLLDGLIPGAFSGALLENIQTHSTHTFNYFSFVTLTTLGYGDITPQTAGASALCQMEAIVGQFFTAVIVAWLVGMFISDKQNLERGQQAED